MLAQRLHWPSVEWGLQHISSEEITEWFAVLKLEADEREAEPRKARR